MKAIKYEKVTSLPVTYSANTVYLLKPVSSNTVDIYYSSNDGTTVFPLNITDSITLIGPTTVGINEVITYQIASYNSFSEYILDKGTLGLSISRVDDIITIVVNSSTGNKYFTVNGTNFNVTVTSLFIRQPKLNTIDGKKINTSTSIVLVSSEFTSTSEIVHNSSDWEIATDSSFVSLVESSYIDTINLTSFDVPGLLDSTVYYARVRHKNNVYGYSNWSETLTFSTGTSKTISLLSSKIFPNDVKKLDKLGYAISVTSDGKRLVIGAPNHEPGSKLPNYGAAYIYYNNNNVWNIEAKLFASDKTIDANFGNSVSISSNGEVIAVGAPNANNGAVSKTGKIYIFRRYGKGWTQQYVLDKYNTNNANFGISVEVSKFGNRVLCGSNINLTTKKGEVTILEYLNGSWSVHSTIPNPENVTTNYSFSSSLSSNTDGTIISVGAPYNNSNKGIVYIFRNTTGTTWTTETIVSTDIATSDMFGYSVKISRNGKRLAVGAPGKTVSTIVNSGACYTFSYSGSWTQNNKLTLSTSNANTMFGYSVSGDSTNSRIIVGSPGLDNIALTALETGSANIYKYSSGSWFLENTLTAGSDILQYDRFGTSVAITSTQMAIIGSPSGPGIANSGSVYTFISSIT